MSLKQQVRDLAVTVLPTTAVDALKSARKIWRRRQWEKNVRDDPDARFTRADLIAHMRDLGVEPGRDLMLHSSMRKVGFIDGGAAEFIEALREVIGPAATLLMPTYPMKVPLLEYMSDPTPFDMVEDRSYMGRITDTFRKLPGAKRSGHPTHSVAALGPGAEDYTGTHHLSQTPCGPGSPFARLSAQGGQILCVGIGIGKVSSHHTIEDQVEPFPIQVYHPDGLFTKTVRFPDGREVPVQTKIHSDEWTLLRVDNDEQAYNEVYRAMTGAGIIQEGHIGRADAHLFRADDLDRVHADRLRREGTTIYRLSAVRGKR
ncbi:MAG: AAC(3) family N-acetyltransferase [Myxococcota bacterium]